MMSVSEMNLLVGGTSYVGGLISSMAGLISTSKANISDPNGARMAGSMASFCMENAGLGVGVEMGTQQALQGLSNFNGVKIGHKLTVKASLDKNNKFGLEVTLEKVTTIEFGDNPRDTIYALVEDTQRVFQVKV
jgi:hypothetical protein